MPHQNSDTESITPIPTSSDAGLDIKALSPRQLRVVLVCDVVESVRWMEHDEDNAITRWSQFAAAVRSRIAPEHAGSVVKSTGDGLMLEFESAPQAVAAANAMQKLSSEGNAGYENERQMHLRIGIHQAQVRRDAHDLYGHGVNLAARISTLAGPGEIIVTPEVRDHLTDSLDGDIEDMGECYLKHLSEPQRVYRVGEAGISPALKPQIDHSNAFKPKIAVMPFELIAGSSEQMAYGDLIADGIISRLVRSNTLQVLSRFSTLAIRNRKYAEVDLKSLLGVDYLLSGRFSLLSNKVLINFELAVTASDTTVLVNTSSGIIDDLFHIDSQMCGQIADAVLSCVVDEQTNAALTTPLPNLASYTLYLAGVAGLHRSMPVHQKLGEKVFTELTHRHPRAANPAAWLAQWIAIKRNRGQVKQENHDLSFAESLLKNALDNEPTNPFALTVSGLFSSFINHDFSNANKLYDQAIELNPNEAYAWLYKATLLGWMDEGKDAVNAAQNALSLTPLHPMRYYIESLSAFPFLISGEYKKAIDLCNSSLKLNSIHTSTHRVLASALMLNGQEEEARRTINKLLKIEPEMTSEKFINRYAGRNSKFAQKFKHSLECAGLPKS